MRPAARWYLAAAVGMILLAGALFLSMQMQAQQQAQRAIQAWGARAGIAIGSIHYQLLHNGLTLRDLRMVQGGDLLRIDQMRLSADPQQFGGDTPHFGALEINGLHIELHHLDQWPQNPPFRQLWEATSNLKIRNGSLTLHLHNTKQPAWQIDQITLQQQAYGSGRDLHATLRTAAGRVRLHITRSTEGSQIKWQGKTSWQHLRAATLATAIGLQPRHGTLDGALDWLYYQHRATTNSPATTTALPPLLPPLTLQGTLLLHDHSNQQPGRHRLQWQAQRIITPAPQPTAQWQLQLAAHDWPLAPWRDALPMIAGRRLLTGLFSGQVSAAQQHGTWHASSAKGQLQDVTLAGTNEKQQPAWYWRDIRYQQASFEQRKRRLHLARVTLTDSRIALQLQPPGDPRSAQPIAPTQPWQLNIDQIDNHNMMLALATHYGQLRITALDGSGRYPAGQPLSFQLQHSSTAAEQPAPAWRLKGQIARPDAASSATKQRPATRIYLHSKRLPLLRLRPLLPVHHQENPVNISGTADIDTLLTLDQHAQDKENKADQTIPSNRWHLMGHAELRQLQISHAGSYWQADRLRLDFDSRSSNAPHIRKLIASDWRYVMPMLPLSADPEANRQQADSPLWWIELLRSSRLHIDQLQLQRGSFFMGNQSVRWGDQLEITLNHLSPQQPGALTIGGRIGDGALHLDGQWNPYPRPAQWLGHATLEAADPFFLRQWLHTSGMPALLRGRIFADLNIEATSTTAPEAAHGQFTFRLLQPLFEPTQPGSATLAEGAEQAHDPLRSRTGFATRQLSQRLTRHHHGDVILKLPLHDSSATPLQLGQQLLTQARKEAAANHGVQAADASAHPVTLETRIRLFNGQPLSLNERIRLAKVAAKLRRHPHLLIELQAHWSGRRLSDDIVQRIRRSQQMIERFLRYKNIPATRIYPVWPSEAGRVADIGFIALCSRDPRAHPPTAGRKSHTPSRANQIDRDNAPAAL